MKPAAQPMQRGFLVDWLTQRWVQATGRMSSWEDYPWLEGPVGDVDIIGTEFFHRFAARREWTVLGEGEPRGLLDSFLLLDGPTCRAVDVHPDIIRFYEQTSEYEFDVWSQWCSVFRPFGWALGTIFSRRLEQLNVPLSPLETRLGITSHVVNLVTADGRTVGTAWIRETVTNRRALYVGSYSTCRVPGFEGTCLKVGFPLPNGYALVVMRPESHDDGSFTIWSKGERFGDPGFYFFVQAAPGRGWARYVSALKESIHVFRDERGLLRADHVLQFWGVRFLYLHYRLRRDGATAEASSCGAAHESATVRPESLSTAFPT